MKIAIRLHNELLSPHRLVLPRRVMVKGAGQRVSDRVRGGHPADREGDAFRSTASRCFETSSRRGSVTYVPRALDCARRGNGSHRVATQIPQPSRRLRFRGLFADGGRSHASFCLPLHILMQTFQSAPFLNYACLLERNNQHLWLAVHLTIPLLLVRPTCSARRECGRKGRTSTPWQRS